MKHIANKLLKTLTWLVGLTALAAIAYLTYVIVSHPSEVEYHREETVPTVLEEVREVIEQPTKSDVEQARDMLAEATQKLDAEEARLMAEIAEREAKIEEINAIRASF